MARKRRGNGEGSIYLHRKGRWAAAISGGYDSKGRHIRRYVYGKTKAEVYEKLLALQNGAKASGIVKRPNRETLESFLTTWLCDVVMTQVRASTHACYETMVRLHIVPHVRNVRLDRLNADDVRRLQTTLRDAGTGPRVQRLVHTVLHRALKHAVRTGKIERNPCGRDLVDAPKYVAKEMRPLTTEQAQLLREAARGDPLEALYVLVLTTGMRSGELFALRWEDVNLNEATLSVRKSLLVLGKHVEFVEPKTNAGRRRIALTTVAVDALRDHRKRLLAKGLSGSPLAFPSAKGTPLCRQNVTRRSFQPLLKRAGLPRIRFHDLRHTFATMMLTQGVHPKVVQEMLGHANIAITLDTYSHVLPSMQQDAVARLDEVFSASG